MSRTCSTHFSLNILKQLKGTICCNCNKDCGDDIIYHHIVPIILGGQDIITNIVPLCTDCHNLIHHGQKINNSLSHSVLIKEGIEKAKRAGIHCGRAKLTYDNLTEEIKQMIIKIQNKEIYKKDAAIKLNISRPTLDKYIKIFNSKE